MAALPDPRRAELVAAAQAAIREALSPGADPRQVAEKLLAELGKVRRREDAHHGPNMK